MKEFFIECLKNLELINGNRQLFYLQSDLEDGKRKLDFLINGMVKVSKKYDYIPESYQKKYIDKMMLEDHNYESLSLNIIDKWLDMHKGLHTTEPKISEKELTPAPPEVADKYAKELLESISQIGNRQVVNGMKEIREQAGLVALSVGRKSEPEESLEMRELKHTWMLECTDLLTGKVTGLSFDEWLKTQKP